MFSSASLKLQQIFLQNFSRNELQSVLVC